MRDTLVISIKRIASQLTYDALVVSSIQPPALVASYYTYMQLAIVHIGASYGCSSYQLAILVLVVIVIRLVIVQLLLLLVATSYQWCNSNRKQKHTATYMCTIYYITIIILICLYYILYVQLKFFVGVYLRHYHHHHAHSCLLRIETK